MSCVLPISANVVVFLVLLRLCVFVGFVFICLHAFIVCVSVYSVYVSVRLPFRLVCLSITCLIKFIQKFLDVLESLEI